MNRLANLLGATALSLADVMLDEVADAAEVSASGASALVTLSAFPRLSVTELGRHVGLSQSAAARMVDTLEANGLVKRQEREGRLVTVDLTEAGAEAAGRLLAARKAPLMDAIDSLDEDDQETLARLLPKMLARLYQHVGDAQLMCRLCDRACCTADAACPVGAAEREHQH